MDWDSEVVVSQRMWRPYGVLDGQWPADSDFGCRVANQCRSTYPHGIAAGKRDECLRKGRRSSRVGIQTGNG